MAEAVNRVWEVLKNNERDGFLYNLVLLNSRSQAETAETVLSHLKKKLILQGRREEGKVSDVGRNCLRH